MRLIKNMGSTVISSKSGKYLSKSETDGLKKLGELIVGVTEYSVCNTLREHD